MMYTDIDPAPEPGADSGQLSDVTTEPPEAQRDGVEAGADERAFSCCGNTYWPLHRNETRPFGIGRRQSSEKARPLRESAISFEKP